MSTSFKQNLLLAFFVSILVIENIAGAKTTTLFGITFSVSLILLPFSFFILDAISEVYGKDKSKEFLYVSLISLIGIFLFIFTAVNLPPSIKFTDQNGAYATVFGNSIRIILASISAYLISQLIDITTFFWIKKQTKNRWLWMRSNFSTCISLALDTFLFTFLAFYQLKPSYDIWFVLQLAIPYYCLKLSLSWIGTPVVYLIVHWLKNTKS